MFKQYLLKTKFKKNKTNKKTKRKILAKRTRKKQHIGGSSYQPREENIVQSLIDNHIRRRDNIVIECELDEQLINPDNDMILFWGDLYKIYQAYSLSDTFLPDNLDNHQPRLARGMQGLQEGKMYPPEIIFEPEREIITIVDGRHRIENLKDLGFIHIPILIERKSEMRLRKRGFIDQIIFEQQLSQECKTIREGIRHIGEEKLREVINEWEIIRNEYLKIMRSRIPNLVNLETAPNEDEYPKPKKMEYNDNRIEEYLLYKINWFIEDKNKLAYKILKLHKRKERYRSLYFNL